MAKPSAETASGEISAINKSAVAIKAAACVGIKDININKKAFPDKGAPFVCGPAVPWLCRLRCYLIKR